VLACGVGWRQLEETPRRCEDNALAGEHVCVPAGIPLGDEMDGRPGGVRDLGSRWRQGRPWRGDARGDCPCDPVTKGRKSEAGVRAEMRCARWEKKRSGEEAERARGGRVPKLPLRLGTPLLCSHRLMPPRRWRLGRAQRQRSAKRWRQRATRCAAARRSRARLQSRARSPACAQ